MMILAFLLRASLLGLLTLLAGFQAGQAQASSPTISIPKPVPHFALEDHAAEIGALMLDFLGRVYR